MLEIHFILFYSVLDIDTQINDGQNYKALFISGIATDEIDKLVTQLSFDAGAYPSPLNYRGFPKSVCTSVNNVVCHGIPDSRPLELGDIINIDITVFLDGHHGDCSETFLVAGKR